MPKNYAIILAAGSGSRMGDFKPKAFLKLKELYILEYSIIQFSKTDAIDHIILVIPKEYKNFTEDLILEKKYVKVSQVLVGGQNRFESSRKGLTSIKAPNSRVLIHDAARPLISQDIIEKCLLSLNSFEAVNVLSPVTDSLVQLYEGKIISSVNREEYRQVQTPQGFLISTINEAHKLALKENLENITDDYHLVLKYKTGTSTWIEGSRLNFKITFPKDLELASLITDHWK